MADINEKTWLTKREIAEDLGIHINSVPRLVAAGRLPEPVRFGLTMIRWPAEEYRAWRQAQIEARDGTITESGRAAIHRGVKA